MCIGKKPRLKPMNIVQKFHLPEPLVQHPAGHLREPVVDAADHREHVDADQHVVDVGDDEIGVGQLPVDRHRRRS